MTYIYYNPIKNKINLVEIINSLTSEAIRYESTNEGTQGFFGTVSMMKEGYDLIGVSYDYDIDASELDDDFDEIPDFDVE